MGTAMRFLGYLAPRPSATAILLLLMALFGLGNRVWAVGDASTSFQVFVPANNDNVGRNVALIVTNCSPFSTTVDIVDRDEDGDSDDTALGVVLGRGQSWVRYIRDGAVNDDAGGKWDGDYFSIQSDHPVVVQMSTKSDWQWDFAPADNKTMRGQSFFLYSPDTSFSQRDVNLVAYEDDTEVFVLDVTVAPTNGSGLTSVNLESPREVLKTVLNEGEDLIGRRGLGVDIFDPGRTYWIRASKGVTCQYGSLVGNARDGGGFVPSENGFATGDKFYFYIPRDFPDEREVRIVSFDDANAVVLSGWNKSLGQWEPFRSFTIGRLGHGDWVESGTDYPMYRLTCTPGRKISVFIASWLEAKGLSGTKDIASFASSQSGYGAGKEFLVYVPQPGIQGNLVRNGARLGNASHIYVFGHVNGTSITVVDADTNGQLFSKTAKVERDGFADIRMSDAEFSKLNKPSQGLRPYLKVTANHLITAMVSNHNDNWMTFVPSVVLPNPLLNVESTVTQATVGAEGCVTLSASNAGSGALTSAQIEFPLDPATTYISSTFSIAGIGEPLITIDPATGGQVLQWQGFTIPAEGVLTGTICYTLAARRPDGKVVKNRDFLSFPILISGVGFGVPVDQGGESETFTAQSSAVVTVDDASQTTVNGLSATPSGVFVNVTWQTGREPDLSGFRVYRSTSGDGPFTLLTTQVIPGTGDAVTGARYQFQNRPPSAGATYYYRLEMVNIANQSSFFGPVAVLAEDRTPPTPPVITSLQVGDDVVLATISGSTGDGDLKGYNIYRSDTSSGIYTKLNELLITPGAVYRDSTVGNGATYFYRAKAVDTSGNISDFSITANAVMASSISAEYTLAFEDQIGPGKNDWDYNDWVVAMKSVETFQGGGVSRVELEIESLARGARYQNAFRLAYRSAGSWTADISVFENRNATTPLSTRRETGTGVVDIQLFADTVEALPPAEGDDFTNTLNRQNPATLGQHARVTLTLASPASNKSASRHRPPFDPYLVNQIGEVHQRREGFPNSTEVVTFWPDSPLLGYHLDYVLVVPGSSWIWPLENQKIWDAYPSLFANNVLSGGVLSQNWSLPGNRNQARTYNWYPFASTKNRTSEPKGVLAATTAELVASYDTIFAAGPKAIHYDPTSALPDSIVLAGSHGMVSVVEPFLGGAMEGWPITANSYRASPAVGKLSASDANPVMVTGEERYDDAARVLVWELTPEPVARWQAEVGGAVKAPPVIADLDGDGNAEILVVTSDAQLVVLLSNGLQQPNSPVSLGTTLWNSKNILSSGGPVVVDIDGDASLEVFAVAPSGDTIYGLSSSLTPLPGWPRKLTGPVVGGVTLAQNPANSQLALFAATADGAVYGLDAFGRPLAGFPIQVPGNVTVPIVAFAEFEDILDMLVVTTTDGTVSLFGTNGAPRAGWPRMAGADVLAPPVVGDLDGDAEMDILLGTATGSVLTWRLDGTLVGDMTFQVPGSLPVSPLLADFDDDARVEVYLATALGDLYRAESTGQTPLPLRRALGWGSVGGGNEANAPGIELSVQPRAALATTRRQVLDVVLGIIRPEDSEVLCDVNLDGVIDAGDIKKLSN